MQWFVLLRVRSSKSREHCCGALQYCFDALNISRHDFNCHFLFTGAPAVGWSANSCFQTLLQSYILFFFIGLSIGTSQSFEVPALNLFLLGLRYSSLTILSSIDFIGSFRIVAVEYTQSQNTQLFLIISIIIFPLLNYRTVQHCYLRKTRH